MILLTVECPKCRGEGFIEAPPEWFERTTCGLCKGSGSVKELSE